MMSDRSGLLVVIDAAMSLLMGACGSAEAAGTAAPVPGAASAQEAGGAGAPAG